MLRKIFVREMLSPSNLDSTFALRREEVRIAIRNVYDKTGSPVDVGELVFVTEGAKFGAEFKTMFSNLMLIVGKPNVSDLFPTLANFDLQGIAREAKEISKNVDRTKDFLQVLLEIREQNTGADSISMIQLKAVLFDVVIAGSDTTTTTVMRKVQEELIEIVGMDKLVEESHLPKLRYLDAVIKETFRLHPPLPFLIPRSPSKSSIIGGYHVPKGSNIFVNAWAIQRDPKYWENPLEFKPERFLNDGCGTLDFSGNNFKYIPFGSGRRICAGSEIDISDTFGIITKKKSPTVAIPIQGYPSLSSTHNCTMQGIYLVALHTYIPV
ncbi:hypothetical protein I3842_Q135000 [Carya illinoinensis]|uniref:Cytochrome P450 n=1 Tax=Carya illinoinensis TaxID=32201 RepID=A0A921ZYA6_CARIL|nr:hypothetical protein I3842_Q135000 [Carya illinoinensis]